MTWEMKYNSGASNSYIKCRYSEHCRNIGMGTCAFWNRIGGMIAPQILLLVCISLYKL